MAIYNLELATFKQTFEVSEADKLAYGEIYTPFTLIRQMLDLFDPVVFTQPQKRWLDIGAGRGYFSMALFERLNQGLTTALPDENKRKQHIVEKMLFMVEVKASNVTALREMFGARANIEAGDFLGEEGSTDVYLYACDSYACDSYDYIIGNPPYNTNGLKKVPTNSERNKKNDGTTAWMHFVRKALLLLRPTSGQLALIIPSIWLKPDKAGMHTLMTSYKIEKMHCLTNTETNTLFKGEAQTPTCYFLLTKRDTDHQIGLYDTNQRRYVSFSHQLDKPLPVFGAAIVQKLQPWLTKAGGALPVLKTNMPPIKSKFTETPYLPAYPYMNIKSCILAGLQPELYINFSDTPQAFHGVKKLVLAHKMYGFPYYDKQGTYGISNRDNYVIIGKTDNEFLQLEAFLSTKFALYIFEATRYRMKYLEKYAFQLLPDITKLSGFPAAANINDASVADYFGLDEADQQHIKSLHRRDYKRFFVLID
jgi:tRNA1(Val) A37 N6-methylase TrmN6